MALTDDSQRGSGSDLIFLQARTQDKNQKNIEKPYFDIIRKIDGEYVSTGTCTKVSGRLKRIVPIEKEFKKEGKVETRELVQFYLEDGAETYKIDFSYKIASRSFYSRVLNLQGGDNVEISLWRDKEGWEVISLRQNGVNVKAKYLKADLPEVQKVKNGKETISLYGPLNEFFRNELTKFNETLGKQSTPVETRVKSEAPVVSSHVEDDDEIPF